MYDISDHKLRKRIAKKCKQIGLKRMQKSVFFGHTRLSLLNRFKKEGEELINEQSDSILILPITEKGMKKLLSLGKRKVKKLMKLRTTHFV